MKFNIELFHATTLETFQQLNSSRRLYGKEWVNQDHQQSNLTDCAETAITITKFRHSNKNLVLVRFSVPEDLIGRRTPISGYVSKNEYSLNTTLALEEVPQTYLDNIPLNRSFARLEVARGRLRFYVLLFDYFLSADRVGTVAFLKK